MKPTADQRHAARLREQAKRLEDFFAGTPLRARFVPCHADRPVLGDLDEPQLLFYRYFRHTLQSKVMPYADDAYARLFAQEVAHGLLPPHLTRAKLLVNLGFSKGLRQAMRRQIIWWAFDAAVLDAYNLDFPNTAALASELLKEPVHTNLALAGLARHLQEEVDYDQLAYDPRSFLSVPHGALSLDEYSLPQDYVASLNRFAIFQANAIYRQKITGRPLFASFQEPALEAVVHNTFEGLPYDGPRHGGVITHVPRYTGSAPLMTTLKAILEIAHTSVLELTRAPDVHVERGDWPRAVLRDALSILIRRFLFERPRPEALHFAQPPKASSAQVGRADARWNPSPRPRRDVSRLDLHQQHARRELEVAPQDTSPPLSADLRDVRGEQIDWYVWWRTQWRRHRRIIVHSLGALQLFAFEVMNLVGFETPEAAYQELWLLLDAVATQTPIPMWHFDRYPMYMTMLWPDLADTPQRAMFYASSYRDPRTWGDALTLAGWLETRNLDDVTFNNMGPLFDFLPFEGAYLERARNPERYEHALRVALEAADRYFVKRRQAGLFDYFVSASHWETVTGLDTMARGFRPSASGLRRPRAPTSQACRRLWRVTRAMLVQVEAAFRKRDGVRGRRKADNPRAYDKGLRATIDAAITPWLAPPPTKVWLSFDPDEVRELERASAATRDLLISAAAGSGAEGDAAPAQAEIRVDATRTVSRVGAALEVAELSSPNVDDAEYFRFVAALNGLHRKLLQLILTGQDLAVMEAAAKHHDELLGAALEAINEQALETMGDIVMDMTDPPTILEEHREPLRAALEEAA